MPKRAAAEDRDPNPQAIFSHSPFIFNRLFPKSPRGPRVDSRVLQRLTRTSTCTRYAQIAGEHLTLSGATNETASKKKMIARYFGYLVLAVFFVIAIVGAYFLGK